MALSSKEKSQQYRDRMKKKKLAQVCGWLNKTEVKKVDQIKKQNKLSNRSQAIAFLVNQYDSK